MREALAPGTDHLGTIHTISAETSETLRQYGCGSLEPACETPNPDDVR